MICWTLPPRVGFARLTSNQRPILSCSFLHPCFWVYFVMPHWSSLCWCKKCLNGHGFRLYFTGELNDLTQKKKAIISFFLWKLILDSNHVTRTTSVPRCYPYHVKIVVQRLCTRTKTVQHPYQTRTTTRTTFVSTWSLILQQCNHLPQLPCVLLSWFTNL